MTIATEAIIEWLGFAAFVVGLVLAFVFSLKMSQVSNKVRFLALFLLYAVHAAGYGAMALGDGDFLRKDSVTVVIGRYVMWLSHLFLGFFLALCIVPNYFAALVTGSLALGQQVFLLAGCRSTGNLIWFYFICAGVCWLINAIVFLVYITPNRSSDANPQQRSALASTTVWIVKLFAIVAFAVYLALYILDQAWLHVVSRQVNVILAVVVDIVIKLIAGLLLLLFFKPEEDQVDNINLTMGLDGNNSILPTQHCGVPLQQHASPQMTSSPLYAPMQQQPPSAGYLIGEQ